MKKTKISLIVAYLLIHTISSHSWSMDKNVNNDEMNLKKIYINGDRFGNTNFPSTEKQFKRTKLSDVCFMKNYIHQEEVLEITGDNYTLFSAYADLYKESFKDYDGSLFIKLCDSSLNYESLIDVLCNFKYITKFKLQVFWENKNVDISAIIKQCVRFYPNLIELTISRCKLTNINMTDIMNNIINPDKLQMLDIRGNKITFDFLLEIKKYFNKTITLEADFISLENQSTETCVLSKNSVISANNKNDDSILLELNDFLSGSTDSVAENSTALEFKQNSVSNNSDDYSFMLENSGSSVAEIRLDLSEDLFDISHINSHILLPKKIKKNPKYFEKEDYSFVFGINNFNWSDNTLVNSSPPAFYNYIFLDDPIELPLKLHG